MRIILDMDEILSDFMSGACKAHGTTKQGYFTNSVAGQWGMETYFGITMEEFWYPIHNEGEKFWDNLERLPWCQEIVRLVDEVSKGDWLIATAPSRDPGCYSGKVKWLKRVFGDHFDRFSIGGHKHFFAQKGTILIDDREANCEKFVEYGGQAIVFPSHGNKFHQFKDDPIVAVKHEFRRLNLLGSIKKETK